MSGRPGGGPPMRRGMGPGGMMGGMPAEKSKNFRASFGRLLGRLRPEAPLIVLVFVLAIVSVAFAVIGPKILGNATNIIFEGVISKQLPAGASNRTRSSRACAQGQNQLADMLGAMNVTPGVGIDFGALGGILARHRQVVCTC